MSNGAGTAIGSRPVGSRPAACSALNSKWKKKKKKIEGGKLGKLNSKERPDARYLVIALPDLRHHIHSYRAFSGTSGHIPVFKLIFIFFFAGPCEEQGSAPFQTSPCACLLGTSLVDNPSNPPPPNAGRWTGTPRPLCAR
jgi:hypothetical protein